MAIGNSSSAYNVQFRKRLEFSNSSFSTSILVDNYSSTDIIVGGSYIPTNQANYHPFISRFSSSGNYYYTNGYNANFVTEVHNGFDYIKQLSDGSFAAVGGGRTFTGQTPGNTIHNSIYMNIANGIAANQMTVLSARAYSNSTNSTFPNRAFTLRESNGNIFIEGQCSTGSTNSINNIYLMKINKSGALNGFLQSFGKSIENETSSTGEHFSIIQDDASNIDLVGIGFSSNSSNTLGISYRIKKNIVADFVLDCKPTFGFNVSNITPTRVAVNPTINDQTVTKTELNLFQKYICVSSLDYCGYVNTKQAITTNELEGVKIYPNPTSNKATIEFTIENDNSKVYLEIFNVLGKRVERIIDGKKLSGNQTIEIDSSNLINGIYLIKLSIDGKVESRELIINK